MVGGGGRGGGKYVGRKRISFDRILSQIPDSRKCGDLSKPSYESTYTIGKGAGVLSKLSYGSIYAIGKGAGVLSKLSDGSTYAIGKGEVKTVL